MKILWISHLFPYPPHGGVRQRSYNLIQKIAETNELHLFAFNQRAFINDPKEMYLAKKEFQKFCKTVQVFDIPSEGNSIKWYWLLFSSLFSPRPYRVKWTVSGAFRSALQNMLEIKNIDLIHVDTIGLQDNVRGISLNPNTKTVLNHHNIESTMMFRRIVNEKNILKKLYFYLEAIKIQNYEKKFCKTYHLNLVVSDLDKERLHKIDQMLEIVEVPNGVDVDYFSPNNIQEEPNTLIFAASMDWYPNHDAMIWFVNEVWSALKKKLPKTKLIIAGRKPQNSLVELCSRYPDINITGFVDDIRPIVEKSSIYICPIRDGGGTKLKLLDAMSMGKAIVSTTLGSEGLEVENNKNILIADTPHAFIEKIDLLFRNPELRTLLGENARKVVIDKYSWSKIGNELNELYHNLK